MDIDSLRNFIYNVCGCNDDIFFMYFSFVPRETCELLDCLPSSICKYDPFSAEQISRLQALADLIDATRPPPEI